MSVQSALSRREVRISVLAGAVAALLVVVAGAWLALTTPTKWTAESVLVVLPGADLNASDSAAYYETLSRGQIVATFAEVADNLRFQQQAEQTLQLSDAQRAGVTTTVSVVPDTSVILVRTTAGTAVIAEQMADATTTLASKYLAGLSRSYRTELVHTAQGWQRKFATIGLFARSRKTNPKDKDAPRVSDIIADALEKAQGNPIWVKIVRWGEKLTTEYEVTITQPPAELMAAGLADAVAQATADAPQEQDQSEYVPPPDEP